MNATVAPDRSAFDAATLARLVRDEAGAEAAALQARAVERAQSIAAAATKEVDALRADAQHAGEALGNRETAKILASAAADSRRQELWEREALVNQVLERARARLADFATQPQAHVQLLSLIEEALQALPDGAVRVQLSDSLAALLDDGDRARLAAGRPAVVYEHVEVPSGGVVVESADGRLRFDNSFAARTARRISRVRRLVTDTLFAAEKVPGS